MAKVPQKPHPKKELLLKCLKDTMGIIAQACEKAGIDRGTYYDWCNKDIEFKSKVDEINEMQIDFVESKLLQNTKKNDTTAIIFYLKTKGKKRGYSEKSNDDDENQNIHLTVTYKNEN